ncbi:hypothetical protein V494_00326 [Pseudogymnoascus sp. VKM F-4513 (FW-928)]|nr:hypothetical protein V494_00326 [Pseudogymnoascus sp. VKM F-4513 (FW-928)]
MVTVDKLINQLELFNGTTTIEELLEKPDVVNFLREAFDSLPPKSKTIARNISSKPPTSSGSKPRCTALVALLEVGEIALPEEVQTIFNGCKESPSKFWSSVGIQNDAICFTGSETINTVASQAYIGLAALNIQRKWDTITWRYYTMFFYDLILLIGDGKVNFTASLHKKLLEVLHNSPLITDSLDIIESNLNTWVTAGSRYSKFCESLDDGALFLLPPLSDTTWENAHSLCGSAYDQAVKHLIDLKICELSRKLGADALGTRIRAAAINPFRWSVETFRVAKPLQSKSAADGPRSFSNAQRSEKGARKRRKKSDHTHPGEQTQRQIPAQLAQPAQTLPDAQHSKKRARKRQKGSTGQQTQPPFPAQSAQPPPSTMAGTGVGSQTLGWQSTDAANLEMLSTAASVTSAPHQISTRGQVDPREQGTQAAHNVFQPSPRNSSIMSQSEPTPPESRIPLPESARCNARWSTPIQTGLFDFNNGPPVSTASEQFIDLSDDPAVIAASQQFFNFNNDPAVIAASQHFFDFNNDPAVIAASQQLSNFNDDPAVIAASQQLFDFNNDPAVIAATQQLFDYDPAVTAAAASQQLFNYNDDVAVG